MGMDVYGKAPRAPEGEYFRASVWSWRPLAVLLVTLSPELTAPCKYWQSNDGDGLGDNDASALGVLLQRRLDDGTVDAILQAWKRQQAALPRLHCSICDGSGIRSDAVGTAMGQPQQACPDDDDGKPHPRAGQLGWCNGCNGTGNRPDPGTFYGIDRARIAEFAGFLKTCGGFEIG